VIWRTPGNTVRVLWLLLLFGLLAAAAVAAYVHLPHDGRAREKTFHVEKGTSFQEISRDLAREGLLRFPEFFSFLARLSNRDQNVRAGVYLFDSSWSPKKILDALCQGRVLLRKVTIPEGLSVQQISMLLECAGLAAPPEVMDASADPAFLMELGLEGQSLEGFLFPDTYCFADGLSIREILRHMVGRFRDVYDREVRPRQEAMGLSVLETVILASIVEKETGNEEEKRLVASVLHNRLAMGMPLQCDPTVIYGIEGFDGNLTREHLATHTPYNTYTVVGLPPGPIANPGVEALRAVVEPAETSYLYFVSKNDGTHFFSNSLEEHNEAVRRYQRGGQ